MTRIWYQNKSTDRDKLTVNKLIVNQRFHHRCFVTDLFMVTLSQSEGLGKMALGIVKDFYDCPSQPIRVIW